MARYFRFYLHTRKQHDATRCHSDKALARKNLPLAREILRLCLRMTMERYYRFYLHTCKQQYASRCHSDEAKRGRISRLHARSFAEAQDDGRSVICAFFPEKRVHGVARKRLVAK